MALLIVIVLGIVQGLTEFLPISSSGHLLIAGALFKAAGYPPLPDVMEVSIVLHVGTLLAILVYYWHRVWRLLGEDRRVIGRLVAGTVPAVLVGLPLKKLAPSLLESPLLAGLMLPVTGAILLWASRRSPGDRVYQQLGYAQAVKIGLFQAVAILPGISRSGSTIAGGLSADLGRESAATFAFLLAIPAIAGAGVLEVAGLVQQNFTPQTPVLHLLLGAATSFLVGLFALAWLIRWLERGRLSYFAWWCIPLGMAATAWQWWPLG